MGIDAELGSGCGAVCIEALRIDTRAAAILTVRAPHDDEAAISRRRNVRFVLIAGGARIDTELGTNGRARIAETLSLHTQATTVRSIGRPGDDEAAAIGGQRRLVLLTGRIGVDALFAAERRSVSRIALQINPVAAAIRPALIRPYDGEAAVGQAGHLRCELSTCGGGIDAKLGTDRHAGSIMALRVDAVSAAILVTRGPHNDVSTPAELGSRRCVLVVGAVGVDLFFGVVAHFRAPWTSFKRWTPTDISL